MARKRSLAAALAEPPPPESPRPASAKQISGSGGPFSSIFSSDWRVLIFCLAFRAVNALLVRTYFDPDEHWQSLEVAHRIAFGYGHLTWEWKAGIRSYVHPLVFALLYKVLAFVGLDTPWVMMRAPRLFQSVFSAIGDLYLYKLSRLIFNVHAAQWALFCQLTNWFMFFCIPRTYSNCLEAVLTTIALYYWFSSSSSSKTSRTTSKKLALLIAALACAIRPTSAITWLYVGFLELLRTNNKLKFLFLEVVPIGVLVFALSCLLDRWMYGSWIIVPLNFLKFNFLSSGGDYYGTHKWHWYFSQGFPAMVFTFLPLSLHGVYRSKELKISGLIAWVLGIYSALGHKEFRFILPMLPLALMFAGYSLATFCYQSPNKKSANIRNLRYPMRPLMIFLLLITNLPMALYTSLVHQRGREDVMNFLADEARNGKVKSILFLMPCHSTPFYSTLHHDLPMHILDCSPGNEKGDLDESDRFKMDPVSFISEMGASWSSHSHIVLFDSEEARIRELLYSKSFIEVRRFFNAHFPAGDILRAFILVYAQDVL